MKTKFNLSKVIASIMILFAIFTGKISLFFGAIIFIYIC